MNALALRSRRPLSQRANSSVRRTKTTLTVQRRGYEQARAPQGILKVAARSFEQSFGGPQKLPPGGFLPHKLPILSPPGNQLPTESKITAAPLSEMVCYAVRITSHSLRAGQRGCAPLTDRGSTHGCRSWSSSHRCDPAAPESCECRSPAPAGVWRTNGGSCGRWLAC